MGREGTWLPAGNRPTEPSIYLRPKRNSRIYFTYALLPPYFQLYGHEEIRVREDAFPPQRATRIEAQNFANSAMQFYYTHISLIRIIL